MASASRRCWQRRGKPEPPRKKGLSLEGRPLDVYLPPAAVQPAPAAVPVGAGRGTGIAGARRAGPWRARGLAGRAAVPLHADHQVSAVVHAQQHLGDFAGPAGVFDRYPAAGAFGAHPPRTAALAAEHGHPHTAVPSTVAAHPGVQRHFFIIHGHNTFPSPRGSVRSGVIIRARIITMPLESVAFQLNSTPGCGKMIGHGRGLRP